MSFSRKNMKLFLLLIGLFIPSIHISGVSRSELDLFNPDDRWAPQLLTEMSKWNFYGKTLPIKDISAGDSQFKLRLTIDSKLQESVEKLRDSNPADYLAMIVLDNETGRVLALAEKDGLRTQNQKSIILTSSHPAASLIKIITSAALIENEYAGLETNFPFVGRATTLYKKQLNLQSRRGVRYLSLKRAFASSNNPVFGLAAIENLNLREIQKMADGFGFNKAIMKYPSVGMSTFPEPHDQYNLAELASGYNTDTNISLVHAVTIPQIIASGGNLIQPKLVDSVKILRGSGDEEEISSMTEMKKKIISDQTSAELIEAMEETVHSGTAKNSFRNFPRHLREKLIVGGKTGSITGGDPAGKHDWFVSFAVPKNKEIYGKGISLAVLTVNTRKWYVKSSRVSRDIIERYYSDKITR